jgi:hypothetical protein
LLRLVGALAEAGADGLGELVADRGMSRLGRVDEVGVTMAWEDGVRRKVEWGSLGEAIVDMLAAAGRLRLQSVGGGVLLWLRLTGWMMYLQDRALVGTRPSMELSTHNR